MKNKKGVIELSVGTIVIIVIAMSMLILGLTLIRSIFGEPEFKITKTECENVSWMRTYPIEFETTEYLDDMEIIGELIKRTKERAMKDNIIYSHIIKPSYAYIFLYNGNYKFYSSVALIGFKEVCEEVELKVDEMLYFEWGGIGQTRIFNEKWFIDENCECTYGCMKVDNECLESCVIECPNCPEYKCGDYTIEVLE